MIWPLSNAAIVAVDAGPATRSPAPGHLQFGRIHQLQAAVLHTRRIVLRPATAPQNQLLQRLVVQHKVGHHAPAICTAMLWFVRTHILSAAVGPDARAEHGVIGSVGPADGQHQAVAARFVAVANRWKIGRCCQAAHPARRAVERAIEEAVTRPRSRVGREGRERRIRACWRKPDYKETRPRQT
jgi:hypothetical protein